jgi:hypothetical protein
LKLNEGLEIPEGISRIQRHFTRDTVICLEKVYSRCNIYTTSH